MVINWLEDTKVKPFDHPIISLSSCTIYRVVVVPFVARLQMLQVLRWMHSGLQESCKEHIVYEDYTGDFHIQTHNGRDERERFLNGR
ncbi:hypothetical protein HanPI659440_Chr09g0347631 [Helianthus annuus]|nr:hypothetical protein HanPI659440_Chr09g0347631 [Helianthus annuus]